LDITFQKAKNGEETALAGNFFLHSNYAPIKEAERFVENLNIPYTPSIIIITEAALSYVTLFLKKKFPTARLGVIRYSSAFNEYNSNFDFVLNYYDHNNFEAYLETIFTEEELLTVFFYPWTPSSKAFAQTDKIVWTSIKAAMERSKTLLITRQYFEKKWFLNSCTFIKGLSTAAQLKVPQDKNVLIISSGPSLKAFLPAIIENQNKFFIICLSSAISLCLKNSIIPDICMTTDGGYWASEHLKKLYNNKIPLAMPAEAYIKKSLLSELPILPLDYGDGISNKILKAAGIPTLRAVRNGTVSGTALLFALNYFTGDVYFCGLDLAAQKGFQHTQPNELELNSRLKDNRINNQCTRLTRSELTNGSLDIYKQWFINNPVKLENRNVFRLINKDSKKNSLGWIEDLELSSFEKEILKLKAEKKSLFNSSQVFTNIKAALKYIRDLNNEELLKKQLFPLDFVKLSHNPGDKETKEKIENEWQLIKDKAENILNENI